MICAAALVLLMDASGSVVHARQWPTLVEGHARAIASEEFVHLLRNGPVALAAVAFAEDAQPLVEWVVLRDADDARGFAYALRQTLRQGPPSLGIMSTNFPRAYREGLDQLAHAPCAAESKILDVVTDGVGPEPRDEVEEAVEAGVEVNVLLVQPQEDDVIYARERLRTPGGFVMVAETWGDFERAMRRKLLMEVAGR